MRNDFVRLVFFLFFLFFSSQHLPPASSSLFKNHKKHHSQIGASAESIWVTSNQFSQSGNNLNFAGTLLTALSVSNLVAGGTQTPWQTGTTAMASVKPMVVSGPSASYPSGCVFSYFWVLFGESETERMRVRIGRTGARRRTTTKTHCSLSIKTKQNRTMYLLATQTSTTLRLLTNTGNLASNSAPTLDSQRTVSSSISIGGASSYSSSPALSSGTAFDGGDDRLIGLSYANGRMLASATTFYGSTSSTPKVRRRGAGGGKRRERKSRRPKCPVAAPAGWHR